MIVQYFVASCVQLKTWFLKFLIYIGHYLIHILLLKIFNNYSQLCMQVSEFQLSTYYGIRNHFMNIQCLSNRLNFWKVKHCSCWNEQRAEDRPYVYLALYLIFLLSEIKLVLYSSLLSSNFYFLCLHYCFTNVEFFPFCFCHALTRFHLCCVVRIHS